MGKSWNHGTIAGIFFQQAMVDYQRAVDQFSYCALIYRSMSSSCNAERVFNINAEFKIEIMSWDRSNVDGLKYTI